MMTHKEIDQRLPDYVLGLLSPGQENEVTEHLADCTACRQTVLGERAIGTLIRDTLSITTRPDKSRLQRLMPPVPQQAGRGRIAKTWAGRLAPALAALLIILGGVLMNAPESRRPMSLFVAATATATSTNTPTATIAQDNGNQSARAPAVTARSSNWNPISIAGSPAPAHAAAAPLLHPTPAAVDSQMAAN